MVTIKKLRVAVVGAGFIGSQHIEAVRRIPGTETAALSDRNPVLLRFSDPEASPSYATFDDGLQIMRVVDACLRSHQSGGWVSIEERKGGHQ